MIIILKDNATKEDADFILNKIEGLNLKSLYMPGVERTVIGAIGDERVLAQLNLEANPCVEEVKTILSKYKLVGREIHHHDSVVKIGNTEVGGDQFHILSGPCAIESLELALESARIVSQAGAHSFRGGIYKPRTSPYSFQGLGDSGLEILRAVKEKYNTPIVSEIIDINDLEKMAKNVDALQIGARNMQNYVLLEAVGKSKIPIFLKRGMSATIEEFLLAAEYIYNSGNENIILCERGIRTFETATRNTLDLNAVAYIKQKSHLPVMVDPSHGTGLRELVIPLSKAALAVGADGLMIETHPNPVLALSDGRQSLNGSQFEKLMNELKILAPHFGKKI